MLSTFYPASRNAERYLDMLFPEQKKDMGLLVYLANLNIVDIGCGITHIDAYSLMNVVEEIKLQLELEGSFTGYDARIKPDGSLRGFSWLQKYIYMHGTNMARRIAEILSGQRARFAPYCSQNARHGFSHQLPGLEKESTDMVLSSWCTPIYVSYEYQLPTFSRIYDVLTPKGQVRLHPIFPQDRKELFESERHPTAQFIREHFDVDIRRPLPTLSGNVNMIRFQTAILTKKSS